MRDSFLMSQGDYDEEEKDDKAKSCFHERLLCSDDGTGRSSANQCRRITRTLTYVDISNECPEISNPK